MRRRVQDLQIGLPDVVSAPTSAANPSQGDRTQDAVADPQLDLSALSPTLRSLQAQKVDMIREVEANVGLSVADMERRGLTDEEIIRELNGGKSQNQIAARIIRQIESGGIDQVDSPSFKRAYQVRVAEAAELARYNDRLTEENINQLAQRYSDSGQDPKVMAEIFAEIDDEDAAVREDYGFWAREAAVNTSFERQQQLERIIKEKSNVQMKAVVAEGARNEIYGTLDYQLEWSFDPQKGKVDFDPDNLRAVGKMLGNARTKMRGMTMADADAVLVGALTSYAEEWADEVANNPNFEVTQAVALEAAADMLEELRDQSKDGNNFAFLDRAPRAEVDKLNRTIRVMKERAKRLPEIDAQGASAKRTNMKAQLLQGTYGDDILAAKLGKPGSDGKVRTLTELRQTYLDELSEGNFTRFDGIQRPDAGNLASIVEELFSSEFRSADSRSSQVDDIITNEAMELALEGQRDEALRVLTSNAEISGDARASAIETVFKITDRVASQVKGALQGEGLGRRIYNLAAGYLTRDPENPPIGTEVDRLEAKIQLDVKTEVRRLIQEREDAGEQITPEMQERIGFEAYENVSKQYEPALVVPDTGGLKAADVAKREGETLQGAAARISNEYRVADNFGDRQSKFTLGGLERTQLEDMRGENPSLVRDVLRLEEIAHTSESMKGVRVLGGRLRVADSTSISVVRGLERLRASEINDEAVNEMVGDFWARSGYLSATTVLYMVDGNEQGVRDSLLNDLKKADVAMAEGLVEETLKGVSLGGDGAGFNPFSIRVEGMGDLKTKYVKKGIDGDVLYLPELSKLSAEDQADQIFDIESIEAILAASGRFTEVTEDTIIMFLEAQRKLHQE